MNRRNGKNKNRKPGEPVVLEFNLSLTITIIAIIVFLVGAIATVKIVTTNIQAKEERALADEDTENASVTWVDSTEIGTDGQPIQVPVPKGYTASQIEGETTVSGGFVIYEGEVNWDEILGTTNGIATYSDEVNLDSSASSDDADNQNVSSENTNNQVTNEESNSIENTESSTTNSNTAENRQAQDENLTQLDVQTDNTVGTNEITENSIAGNETEGNTVNEKESEEEGENITTSNTTGTNEIVSNGNSSGLTDGEDENQIGQNEQEETTTEQETQNMTTGANTISKEETVSTLSNNGIATLANETEDSEITETDIAIFNLQKTTNQFVWVPVKDVSRIYGVDADGNLWGKLYNFNSSGRTALNWTETAGIMSITSKTNYREPDVTRSYTSYDIDSKLQSSLDGMTRYELLTKELEQDFYATMKSIQKYGGFYIGRYETGNLSKTTAVVQKMNTDIDSQTWYTMYEKSKALSGTNDNVTTSMIWGCLWDETLAWLVESGATISDGTTLTYALVGSNSKSWGNYYDNSISYIPAGSDIPEATAVTIENSSDSSNKIPTGSSEYTKANNIYDMAGNVSDWTLEASSTSNRVNRGGYYLTSVVCPASRRYDDGPTSTYNSLGSRLALYICSSTP